MACSDCTSLEARLERVTLERDAARSNFLNARNDRDVAILAVRSLQQDNDELRARVRDLEAKLSGQTTLELKAPVQLQVA